MASSSYYTHDAGYNGRRTVVFVAIVAAHVLLGYAFTSGLINNVIEMVAPPIDTTIIDEEKVKDEAPPPPPPEMERPPVQIVAPEISITIPVDAPPPPITNVTTRPPPAPPPPVVRSNIARVSGPSTDDFYPSISRSAGEEGRPIIQVCVDANGKIATVEVAESSGFERLDEAAVRFARASRWKAPAENGKAIAGCAKLPIRFTLKKAAG
jgi:protein TonB